MNIRTDICEYEYEYEYSSHTGGEGELLVDKVGEEGGGVTVREAVAM